MGLKSRISSIRCGATVAVCAILFPLIPAHAEYYWGNVRFDGGGFVNAVLFHPKAKDILYARTDVGGVYRFDAANSRWIPLTDWISEEDRGLFGGESFAIDPNDPKRLYVLAGTGYFSNGRTAILRSENYGDSFDTTYVDFLAHGNGMGRQTGEKLVVDPNMPNILFCGSRTKGLYKSTDYGKTWNNIYQVAISSATGNALTNVNGISFVVIDSTKKATEGHSSTIYLGISAKTDNLQISTDGGKTWNVVTGGPTNLMPHRAKLVGDELFLTYSNSEGPHSVSQGAVYKYNTATKTWTNITPFQDESTTARMGDGSQSASHGFGGISIDPNDVNHIVVTTLCYYGGRHFFASEKDAWGDRIYVTTDGGKTWTHGQGYNDGVNIDALDNQWIEGNAIHWAGSIEFDPFNTKKVWVTSGNGVFQTDDITAKVPVWKFQSKGIEETVPLDIVSVVDGPLVTAIGDYDGATYTDITKSTPRHNPAIGTTNSLGYAPLANAFVRTGHVTDYSTGTGIESDVMYRSDDNGATWKKLETTLKGSQGTLAMSADGKVILHRPDQSNMVYRTTDNGTTWESVTGLDGQCQYARFVPDPVNPDKFYLVDAQGYLKLSTDGGASFANAGTRLQNDAAGEYYNGGGLIRTVPGKEGHLWVPLDQAQTWLAKGYSENGLAYTEDGGNSWIRLPNVSTAISVGLGKAKEGAEYPTVYIWGIAGSAENPLGIYRSTDKGETWERLNDGMHQFGGPGNGGFVVGDMNVFGVVYMSTIGRGIIYGAPEGSNLPIPQISKAVQAFASVFVEKRNLTVLTPNGSHLTIFDLNGNVLLSESVLSNQSVNLERLAAGRFFVKITSAQNKTLLQQTITLK